jgi:hypothetical protein
VWNAVFQVLKENNCQPRLLYSAKVSFVIKGEIKTFHDKQKSKEISDQYTSTTKRYLKESYTLKRKTNIVMKHKHENARKNKSQ